MAAETSPYRIAKKSNPRARGDDRVLGAYESGDLLLNFVILGGFDRLYPGAVPSEGGGEA